MRRVTHRDGPASAPSPYIPSNDEVPFADKLRQQENNSVSSQSSRRQPVNDETHSLMSGGTRSKRKPVPMPASSNVHRHQQQRPSKNRMRAVLAAFGDCTAKREEGQRRRVISCGVAPSSVQDTEIEKQPEKNTWNYRRLILLTLIVASVFGLGRSNGRHAALRGHANSISVADWLKDANVNISSLSSLEKSLELFSAVDENDLTYNQQTNMSGFLVNNPNHTYHQAVFPVHITHLSNLTTPYDSTVETPYFWDVHFSGESVAEAVFSTCHGLILAAEHGLRQSDYDEEVSSICHVVHVSHAIFSYGTALFYTLETSSV